ncbi:hypothetical protein OQA88_7072 [Cercophora sp. LCS_1]
MASSIPDRSPVLFGVNTAGVVLAGISCLLRCFVRTRILKSFGLDDYLMVLSTLTFTAYGTLSNVGISYGTGRHHTDLEPANEAMALRCWFWCYITYSFTMIFVKLSIGWFLLRITLNTVHRWIIYLASVITCTSCLTFFFLAVFQCSPISYFWDKHTQTGACINMSILVGLAYLYSAFSIISDFTFALLPAWIVTHLNMKRNAKYALIGLMGMGCVASAGVVLRMPYLKFMGSDDFLWETTPMAIWSTVECSLAITAGCLATLQPLVKLVGEKLGIYSTRRETGMGADVGAISVRRSVTRRTERFELSGKGHGHGGEGELKLQPGVAEYSAMCYNTSQEELRPDEAGIGKAVSAKEIP